MSIAGWVDYNKDITESDKVISLMTSALIPINNDSAVYTQKQAVLIQSGKQTVKQKNVNGEIYTIVFNGKLKKDSALIDGLKCLKYSFCADSDAETVLCCYIEWQEKCLDKINGSYCFAIWKQNEKTLFLARDRLGAVPIYYYSYNGGIIFGDIQVLLKHPYVPKKIDSGGIMQIFLLGPGKICGSGIIKDVSELKPSHYINFSDSGLKSLQYWQLKAKEHTDSFKDTARKIKDLVTKSYMGDFDSFAAYMLSGGLDSSIVCSLARTTGVTPQTYSLDFEDNEKNFAANMYQPERDIEYIKIIVRHLSAENNLIVLKNSEIADSIEQALLARGLPGMADIDSSLLLLCEIIAKKHKVCFSGECADEFFGGYPWYMKDEMLGLNTFPWSQSLSIRERLLKKDVIKQNAQEYVKKLYDETVSKTDYLPQDSPKDRRIREMFNLNKDWFMQTLLDRGYKMASFAGIEIRMPFCDYNIVEYAYNIPWKFKAFKGQEKGILREAFKDILPPKIVGRKKSPFPKTYSPLFFNRIKEKLNLILNKKDSLLENLIDKDYLNRLIENPNAKIPNWYGQLMRLPQIMGYIIQIDSFFKQFNIDIV